MWSHLNLDMITAHHNELIHEMRQERLAGQVLRVNHQNRQFALPLQSILNRVAFVPRRWRQAAAIPATSPVQLAGDHSLCCTA